MWVPQASVGWFSSWKIPSKNGWWLGGPPFTEVSTPSNEIPDDLQCQQWSPAPSRPAPTFHRRSFRTHSSPPWEMKLGTYRNSAPSIRWGRLRCMAQDSVLPGKWKPFINVKGKRSVRSLWIKCGGVWRCHDVLHFSVVAGFPLDV